MSIRELINQPVVDKEIVVEGKYKVKGRPDASILGRSLILAQREREMKAAHYKNMGIGEFDTDMVAKILLVHETLQPEEGEQRYDETEIAQLASKQGPLFLQLAAAACEVVGLVDDKGQQDVDVALKAALGNSPATASDSASSTTASEPQARTRTFSGEKTAGSGKKSSKPQQ